MTVLKRVALFAALFAAQLALAAACHAQEAEDPHIVATAEYPDGVHLLLTDSNAGGGCRAAASLPPGKTVDSDEMVVGCWETHGNTIRVTFLLGSAEDDAQWVEEYPLSDFRLTTYGLKRAKILIHVSPT